MRLFARALFWTLIAAGTSALPGQTCPVDLSKPNVFSDGDWNGWDLTGFTQGAGGTSSGSLVSSSGNPGAFRRVDITVNAGSASDPPGFWGFHHKGGVSYDPRAKGAIGSVDYCEDAEFLGIGSGDGQATGPAVRQNGKVYVAIGLVTGVRANWTTLSRTGLTAASFSQLQGPAGFIDSNSHPDFSSSGSTIEVGFFRANSSGGAGIPRR